MEIGNIFSHRHFREYHLHYASASGMHPLSANVVLCHDRCMSAPPTAGACSETATMSAVARGYKAAAISKVKLKALTIASGQGFAAGIWPSAGC